MKQTVFAFISFACIVFSCKKDGKNSCYFFDTNSCTNNSNYANVRIQNISQYDFCSINITSPGISVSYNGLQMGHATCYQFGNPLYPYAAISLYIDGKEFTCSPIDYPSNLVLSKGFYSYKLDIPDFNSGLVTIQLKKDY